MAAVTPVSLERSLWPVLRSSIPGRMTRGPRDGVQQEQRCLLRWIAGAEPKWSRASWRYMSSKRSPWLALGMFVPEGMPTRRPHCGDGLDRSVLADMDAGAEPDG
ncbi:transcriptional regulator [Striga asiatica]|uniref:Transcriptional regulator n=1 Tax=Striga asiatica TaxID=4170 RepID=A0A5A7R6U4_STRAF|nr:transcriptional regulator [Striga asiatica]